jgi:two-component system LytT family response regulator
MKMRTLIVDDEPLAREGIALALRKADDVEIVGSCPDGPSAVRSIRRLEPDLVFLDIRMPGLDGFEVIQEIGVEHMPAVIFLTAYEEHAMQAFRVNAIDYLLKPVDDDELKQSLDRARKRVAEKDAQGWTGYLREFLISIKDARPKSSSTERIVVRTGGRVYFLDPKEIAWVEASGDYVTLHTSEKSHLVRDSIRSMQMRLSEHGFRRIHRSTLVRLNAIRELIANDSGDGRVILHDGTELKFSRTYRNALYMEMNAAP